MYHFSRNSGFLMLELIISLALSSIIILSVFEVGQVVKRIFSYELERVRQVLKDDQDLTAPISFNQNLFSNLVGLLSNATFETLSIDTNKISGRADSCNPTLQNNFFQKAIVTKVFKIPTEVRNTPTALVARNGNLFVTLDSSTSSDPDLMILRVLNGVVELVSEIHNGPGFLSERLVGDILFVGNSSVTNQLLIYSVSNPDHPTLLSSLKLSPPSDEQTVGFQLTYQKNILILGLKKTVGAELRLIDVSRISNPREIAQYEVGSQINDVILDENNIFIATPKNEELEKLLYNPQNLTISKVSGFDAPKGNGNGKSLDKIGNKIFLGRTVGDKELYVLQNTPQSFSASSSMAVGWSIDDLLVIKDGVFLITPEGGGTLSIINAASSALSVVKKVLLTGYGRPVTLTCDGGFMYVLTDQGYIWSITT